MGGMHIKFNRLIQNEIFTEYLNYIQLNIWM